MIKDLDSASALIALSSSDLTFVTGAGLFGSDTPPQPPPAPPPSNVTPQLVCPAGTAPQWRRITGNLSGNVGTAGLGVSANGSGTYEEFSCRDVPSSTTPGTGG